MKKYEYYHTAKRNISMNVSYEELKECIDDRFKVTNLLEETELVECVNAFLKALPPENRKVFMLRYWYFMSIKEIQAECQMSKSKVESILYRTRKKVKKTYAGKEFL